MVGRVLVGGDCGSLCNAAEELQAANSAGAAPFLGLGQLVLSRHSVCCHFRHRSAVWNIIQGCQLKACNCHSLCNSIDPIIAARFLLPCVIPLGDPASPPRHPKPS